MMMKGHEPMLDATVSAMALAPAWPADLSPNQSPSQHRAARPAPFLPCSERKW